jgi:hypothetical protein
VQAICRPKLENDIVCFWWLPLIGGLALDAPWHAPLGLFAQE